MVPCTPDLSTPLTVDEEPTLYGPWYAFIDGPRDKRGNRESFESIRAALLWITILVVVVAVFAAVVITPILVAGFEVAMVGYLVPASVVIGPFLIACLIACVHTIQDLGRLLGARVVNRQ
jgi:hypothetical protein